jgi:hypothetical protein
MCEGIQFDTVDGIQLEQQNKDDEQQKHHICLCKENYYSKLCIYLHTVAMSENRITAVLSIDDLLAVRL